MSEAESEPFERHDDAPEHVRSLDVGWDDDQRAWEAFCQLKGGCAHRMRHRPPGPDDQCGDVVLRALLDEALHGRPG